MLRRLCLHLSTFGPFGKLFIILKYILVLFWKVGYNLEIKIYWSRVTSTAIFSNFHQLYQFHFSFVPIQLQLLLQLTYEDLFFPLHRNLRTDFLSEQFWVSFHWWMCRLCAKSGSDLDVFLVPIKISKGTGFKFNDSMIQKLFIAKMSIWQFKWDIGIDSKSKNSANITINIIHFWSSFLHILIFHYKNHLHCDIYIRQLFLDSQLWSL